mgnify:CR=1 FL=1
MTSGEPCSTFLSSFHDCSCLYHHVYTTARYMHWLGSRIGTVNYWSTNPPEVTTPKGKEQYAKMCSITLYRSWLTFSVRLQSWLAALPRVSMNLHLKRNGEHIEYNHLSHWWIHFEPSLKNLKWALMQPFELISSCPCACVVSRAFMSRQPWLGRHTFIMWREIDASIVAGTCINIYSYVHVQFYAFGSFDIFPDKTSTL